MPIEVESEIKKYSKPVFFNHFCTIVPLQDHCLKIAPYL